MNQIFWLYLHQFVLVISYDILVYSQYQAQLGNHLSQIFQNLSNNHLHRKVKKCQIGQIDSHLLCKNGGIIYYTRNLLYVLLKSPWSFLLNKSLHGPYHRWPIKLIGLDFELDLKKGTIVRWLMLYLIFQFWLNYGECLSHFQLVDFIKIKKKISQNPHYPELSQIYQKIHNHI